ncbi:MAG: sigma-54 dependent transcriptional regulator [Syntrophobacterales bacterium]|jgi:DNA-binding NtrC family response regulator|nr:sigma-54 dependent transcriptional regulator [Syntrophobacterales bacterium]
MKKAKILIADDNESNRQNLTELMLSHGYDVKAVEDGREAMKAFQEDNFDITITDLKMPHADGLEVLRFTKEINPGHVVILITGYATVNNAVEAMKEGAFDFIAKPFKDDLVSITVQRAVAYAKLREDNVRLRDDLKDKYDLGKLLGYSGCMKRVFSTIEKVANSDSTVLIYGESGTGKELVAKAIHFNSPRKNNPLVPINCGAIPEDLLESELFGHEKGAFTGAIRSRPGRFELAQGGTLFLDEIGDMSPTLQVKLLRAIQEKQFERVGGVKTFEADVRIIAATHQDLERAVEEKRFREDLYYRINVIPLDLPPLRERGPDIAILANHFLNEVSARRGMKPRGMAPDVVSCLMRYLWPGNVRELQNLMEMLVVMNAGDEITVDDLPEKIRIQSKQRPSLKIPDLYEEGFNYNDAVTQFEKDLLLKALEISGGVKNKAAKLLALNRTTLVEKLKRFQLGG